MRVFFVLFMNTMLFFTTVAFTESTSLFEDLSWTHGVRLSAVDSSLRPVEIKTILAYSDEGAPCWRLAQWGTRFNLASAEEEYAKGIRSLSNPGKTVTVFPGGLPKEGVLLAVNGGAEYGGKLRRRGEAWPHLLIEQQMKSAVFLDTLETLNFNVAFKVAYCRLASKETVDPALHTAHITAFWVIRNANKSSDDFNDMIWFGLPLFDARYSIPRGHQAVDQGKADASGKFICTIDGTRFFPDGVKTGEWQKLSCDMLPLVHEALSISQKKGFLTKSSFEDFSVTSFNLGWEVPGPYDCAIHLRNLSLVGTKKP